MKRMISVWLLSVFLICSFAACKVNIPEESGSQDASSESRSEESSPDVEPTPMNSLTEFYDKDNVDFDLTLFDVSAPKSIYDSLDSRVIILSDNHYKAFSGVGGYTDAERQQLMIDALLDHPNDYDCVIFAGDMANQNELYKDRVTNPQLYGEDYLQEWINTYYTQLRMGGISAYCINGSHDACLPEEFEGYFGYENNYVVLAGTTAYICVDVFSGERNTTTYETTAADIPAEFVTEVAKLLAHDYVQNAFVVLHRAINNFDNVKALVGMDKVVGTIHGDSHYNETGSFCGKPKVQSGHFSRGYTKMITWGLGFTPFVATPFSMPSVTDENGKSHKDWSQTGSPWQYRIVEFSGTNEAYTLESYQVYPEMQYLEFRSDSINWASFRQPYTEARPSFLGEAAPIDKSYKLFKKVE